MEQEGPAEAFAAFYSERWLWAVRLAHVLSGNRCVAEDIAQDAFARLCPRFGSVDDPVNYVRVSILNGIRTIARTNERATRRMRLARPPANAELGPHELLDAVDRLPHREKAVLVLRFYEDLPDAAIAEIIGCRPATIRTAAARGLRRLRRDLS